MTPSNLLHNSRTALTREYLLRLIILSNPKVICIQFAQ